MVLRPTRRLRLRAREDGAREGGPRPHSPARPPKFGCGEDEEDGDESGAACSPDDAARGGTQCGGEVVSSLRSRATQVHREGGSRHFAFGAIRLNGG